MYLRHQALLNVVVNGSSTRDNLQQAWNENQSPKAYAMLYEGPRCPAWLEYYLDHAYKLVGRSGEGMNGAAPLSWRELGAYQRETTWRFWPGEKDLLMRIDSLIRKTARDAVVVPTPTLPPPPSP